MNGTCSGSSGGECASDVSDAAAPIRSGSEKKTSSSPSEFWAEHDFCSTFKLSALDDLKCGFGACAVFAFMLLERACPYGPTPRPSAAVQPNWQQPDLAGLFH